MKKLITIAVLSALSFGAAATTDDVYISVGTAIAGTGPEVLKDDFEPIDTDGMGVHFTFIGDSGVGAAIHFEHSKEDQSTTIGKHPYKIYSLGASQKLTSISIGPAFRPAAFNDLITFNTTIGYSNLELEADLHNTRIETDLQGINAGLGITIEVPDTGVFVETGAKYHWLSDLRGYDFIAGSAYVGIGYRFN